MHVIVVGCGRVGSELAIRLVSEGHDVVVLDKRGVAFRRLPAGFAGTTVVGFGFDQDHLRAAGAPGADALAAVTSGDNTNILTARIARETFEIQNVVARIYDPRRALIYQRLGIPTVATVSWTVDQVVRRLLPEQSVTSWTDPTGQVSMVEHALPTGLAGKRLGVLVAGDRYRPVVLTRGGEARLATPDMVGQEGDVLLFTVRTGALGELETSLKLGAEPSGSRPPEAGPSR
ncbi:MAG: potassium channel family protein [Acidimicrobiales bacterium]